MEASIEAASAEDTGRFHEASTDAFEASTTFIGACFGSIKVSSSLHCFRRSFCLRRSSLPCGMETSVVAMEASMEAMESSHFLWGWKLPRILPLEPSIQASRVTSAEAPRSCDNSHRLPYGFACFHLGLRPMNVDVLALHPLASMRFHVLQYPWYSFVFRTKGNRIEAGTEGTKLEASTEGSVSRRNSPCSPGNLQ